MDSVNIVEQLTAKEREKGLIINDNNWAQIID